MRSGADTPRHLASAAAAARAVALCSGLWSGGQTREMIDRDNPAPASALDTQVDEAARIVAVRYDAAMPPRLVMWRPVLGCVAATPGSTRADLAHLPRVRTDLAVPDLDGRDWPMGDANARGTLPRERQAALDAVVAAAFDGATYGARTWGVVVVKDGRIVAERYAEGYGPHVGEQTHSAAKSFASSIVGLAVRQHGLDIRSTPALSEWNHPGDPRRAITVEHLLRMSSGLYGEGSGSPLLEIYNGGGTVAGRAATNVLDTLPGTRFLYNPPDTLLFMRAVRQRVDDDARYLEMPFTDFFWKIGMTRTVTSSDWNGDFQMSGQTYSTARDFARFGILYLNDGVWNGERILPEGWSRYVATPGPVQPAGDGPRYGAQFWLYGGLDGLPPDAYSPNGGLGQYAMIVPSQNLVVVRRGHDPASGGFRIARFSADVVAALAPAPAAASTAAPARVPPAPSCDADGALQFVCGPTNAEDLVRIGDSRWLIASGMDGALVGAGAARGHLYLIDHRDKRWQEAFPGAAPRFRQDRALYGSCPGPLDVTNFSAHGLALRERAPGRYRLYVTGHGAREAIEVFEVDATGAVPVIQWTGCVPLPDEVSANSVAILPDWGFVTTKFLDRRLPQQESFAQVRQGLRNGAVYEWHPGGPVRAIAGTEMSAPNGIEVSPDGNTLYVAAFGTRELVRFRRSDGRLQKDVVALDVTPDNLRWSSDGKLLTAGGNFAGAGNPPATGWSVVEIDPETLAVRRLAGGERSPGMQAISVGLEVEGALWLGTFSGDRVAFLPLR